MVLRNVSSWLLLIALAMMLLFLGAVTAACASVQKAMPFMPSPQEVACVLDKVEQGVEDPKVIALDCGLVQLAIEDLLKLIMGAKTAKAKRLSAHPPDAGLADAGDGGK